MKKFLSRPLAPHLSIYSGQYTSIYSIWHRITGVCIIIILAFLLLLLKVSSYKIYPISYKTFMSLSLWIKNSIYLNLTLLLSYHILNGLRHIFWDLGFILSTTQLLNSVKFLSFTIFTLLIFIMLKNVS